MQENHANRTLIAPHGGTLINRLRAGESGLMARAQAAPGVRLSDVAISDLELIATGVYSPLTGFMGQAVYRSVIEDMHLPNGLPWTLPVTLAVDSGAAESLRAGADVGLMDESGRLVGLLELSEKYPYDKIREAQLVYGTTGAAHPGVARLYAQGDVYLAGDIWLFEPRPPAFPDLALTPQQTRQIFVERGWRQVVAFQTRNPIHRAHEYLQKCALEMVDGLLLHPLVGETKADDVPAAVRVESYRVVLEKYYPVSRVLLSAFPAAMRYAGPREAVFHAICRKNYGCTHFIVGRDHAGVGSYYGTYDAQRIFDSFDPALIGIVPIRFEHAFYCRDCDQVVTAKTCPHGETSWLHLSGTQIRALLADGQMLPEAFTRPEVSRVLMNAISAR